MKLIYRLLSIIFLIGSILWLPPTKAATISEQAQVIDEVISLCNYYNTYCSVRIVDDFRNVAYTKNNDITISNTLANNFPKDELRGILYHELGHVLNQHSQKGQAIMNQIQTMGKSITPLEAKQIRHRFEYEADAKATQLLYENKKPQSLSKALMRISKGRDRNKDTISHPSTNQRVRNINKYYLMLRKNAYGY